MIQDSPKHPLKQWMSEKGVTQAQVARDADCSEPHLSDVLNYKKSPSLDLTVRLSKATGGEVPLDGFVRPEEAVQ